MSSLLLTLTAVSSLIFGLRVPLEAHSHKFASLSARSHLAAPLAIRRAGCVQLVAQKKGCGKAQNRKATKPGDAVVMSKSKASGAHGKGKRRKANTYKGKVVLTAQIRNLNQVLSKATSMAVVLTTSANITGPTETRTSSGSARSDPDFAELLVRLQKLESFVAESGSETSSLQAALSAKATEVQTLKAQVSTLSTHASQAEREAAELQAKLKAQTAAARALCKEREAAERAELNLAVAWQAAKVAAARRQARTNTAAANQAVTQVVAPEAHAQHQEHAQQQVAQATCATSPQVVQQTPSAQEQALMPPLALEDYMLNRTATPTSVFLSVQHGYRHMSSTVGLEWAYGAPTAHELAVRNASQEIYIVFRLGLAPQSRPWSPHTRRLIITHVGVPTRFQRQGILARTMDELAATLKPDEIEIDRILSERMRKYACTRGYSLVSGHEAVGGTYRRTR